MIGWNKYIKPMLANDDLKNVLYDLPAYDESIRNDDISNKLDRVFKMLEKNIYDTDEFKDLFMLVY